MTLNTDQIAALNAPLSRDNVKTRDQSGRKLSYIEGWVAIKEANRIFGFGGWTRETVDLKLVAEKPRKIGTQDAEGWGVTYIARVRITVRDADKIAGGIVREGCGTGHGIDRDLGQAHESALKEAETDAMKRALMTFGNPFGLALYDKDQAEVSDAPVLPTVQPEDADVDAGVRNWVEQQKEAIGACTTLPDLTAWLDKNGGDLLKPALSSSLDRLMKKNRPAFNDLKTFYLARMNKL